MQGAYHSGVKFVLYFIFLFLLCLRIILLYLLPINDGSIVTVSGYIYTNITRSTFRLSGINIKAQVQELGIGDYVEVTGVMNNGVLVAKSTKIQKSNQGNLRVFIVSRLKKVFRTPYLGLVLGIGIGDKSNISKELYSKLKGAGLVHIVVASGSNIALLVSIIMPLTLQIFSRRKAIFLCLFIIWSYVWIITFEAPIVRAAIMATFVLLAQLSGRLTDSLTSLFLSAGIMLFINPSWVTDLGFYLSFSATFALILLPNHIDKLIPKFVPIQLRSPISTSFSAQLGVIPISLIFFHKVTIVGFLTNILVAPVMPIITTLSFATILLSLASVFLAKIISFILYPPLSWFLYVVNVFS